MLIELKRVEASKNGKATIGKLYLDGAYECWTLEDTVREVANTPVAAWKLAGETAIPVGTYRVIIDFSNRFQRLMPHVLNVPGFDGIRIHPGNTDADTEGCILLGQVHIAGQDCVANSKLAFDAFYEKLKMAVNVGDAVMLTISNEFDADVLVV